jgi:lantibiotic modifying enzyme
VEAADAIGSRLCRDAIWSGNRCNWLGWALDVVGAAWAPVYKAQTPFVYDGTAGIALFLGRLFSFTGEPLHREAALGALNHAIGARFDLPPYLRAGAYSGRAGVAWVTIDLGEVLDDGAMIERGLRDLKTACSEEPHPAWVDIIGGAAGTIQVLLDIARRFDQPELIQRASHFADLLLKCAAREEAGWSWDTIQGQSEKHLCGYGHGAGGIGCALLDLWSATGNKEYRRAALEAFRYEASHFSPQHHNWPDLRNHTGVPAGQPVFAAAWCHGAPGVGLSRLRALELTGGGEKHVADLNEAVQATAATCANVMFPASGNLCLCHGIGGNADLLLAAADQFDRPDLRQIAEAAGLAAIAQIRTPDLPWPCGVTTGGESPNLMIGIAGIGHFFLRLFDSEAVPSVMLLGSQGIATVRRKEAQVAAVAAR